MNVHASYNIQIDRLTTSATLHPPSSRRTRRHRQKRDRPEGGARAATNHSLRIRALRQSLVDPLQVWHHPDVVRVGCRSIERWIAQYLAEQPGGESLPG